ncbi:MAG TPA: mechanosensitive ion channel family protein [Candidatus Limiplasma sp.]|nr:mechanosensitive ion channel family protein [Candidatus Limiplasma sp.]
MEQVQTYFASIDLTTWLIACGLIVVMFIIKRPLASVILRGMLSAVKRKNPDKAAQLLERLTKLLGYILFVSLLLVALPYIDLSDTTTTFINRALTSLLLFLAYSLLYRTLMVTVNWYFDAKAKKKPDRFNLSARNFLISGIRVAVIVLAAISVLSRWVSNLSGLVAGLGISSLAVALAAQDSLSNFFGSISIMLDKPFDVGDYIVISGDLEGNVERVGLRSTRVRQLGGSLVTVPNANLANAVVYNETKRSQRRVHFTVGLEYRTPDENLHAFIRAVEALLIDDPDTIDDSIKVWFDAFADSSLNVGVIYRTHKSAYYDMLTVKDRINHAVLQAAKDTGVSMAFPSVSVYTA